MKQKQKSSNLEHLAYRAVRLNRLLKRLGDMRNDIKTEFFLHADENIPEHTLPTVSILVPSRFFLATGMSESEFIQTRFPSWTLIKMQIQKTNDGTGMIFVLRKKPSFMPYNADVGEYSIARSIADPTPEVDWDTMKAESPEIFDRIAKPVVSYEIDVEEFQKLSQEDPTFDNQGFLQRHTKHKNPTLRLLGKEINAGE